MDDQQQIITIGSSSLTSQSEHLYQIEDVIANHYKIIAGLENNDGIQSYLCNDLQTNNQMVLYVLPAAVATNSAIMEELENLVGDVHLGGRIGKAVKAGLTGGGVGILEHHRGVGGVAELRGAVFVPSPSTKQGGGEGEPVPVAQEEAQDVEGVDVEAFRRQG